MSLSPAPSDELTRSATTRAKLDHPVVDADGHVLEVEPVLLDFLKDVAGAEMVSRYEKFMTDRPYDAWHDMSWEERFTKRPMRPAFWFTPARNTLDRATAMLPGLMRARLDDFGLDVSILYTTQGLAVWRMGDAELRRATIRALNAMHADIFRGYGDRLIPAAVIPMQSPDEAIEELEFAVGELGMKAIMVEGTVRRPYAGLPRDASLKPYQNKTYWIDTLALDSAYDYDPVWAKCIELKVAPTVHTGTMDWGARGSVSNYNYNHIGHFAAGNEAVCKALFFGGVTRRFPNLRFGFLESGVGWACSLYNDIIEHWEKRNVQALMQNLDPRLIDRDLLAKLFIEYGEPRHKSNVEAVRQGDGSYFEQHAEDLSEIDEWDACGIVNKEDIYDRFVPNFYFGCEADDRIAAWAFNGELNQFGARLNALFSSDIGHWDVNDATTVLAESYEFVERGLLAPDDYRDFVFTNAVTLYAGLNRDFFKGTPIERDAAAVLTAEDAGRPVGS